MSDEKPENHTKRLPASELPDGDDAAEKTTEDAPETPQPEQQSQAQHNYPQPQHPYAQYPPPYGYGYFYAPPPPRPTNPMAIAAMVVGIITLMSCQPLGFISIILGHMARRQMRETGEDGDGFATVGIITGWIGVGVSVLLIFFFILIFLIPLIIFGAAA